MCRTPEEAAWTLLSMTAQKRVYRVLTKAIQDYLTPRDVRVDVVRDAARNSVIVEINLHREFSSELWRQLAEEVEREPTLVG